MTDPDALIAALEQRLQVARTVREALDHEVARTFESDVVQLLTAGSAGYATLRGCFPGLADVPDGQLESLAALVSRVVEAIAADDADAIQALTSVAEELAGLDGRTRRLRAAHACVARALECTRARPAEVEGHARWLVFELAQLDSSFEQLEVAHVGEVLVRVERSRPPASNPGRGRKSARAALAELMDESDAIARLDNAQRRGRKK